MGENRAGNLIVMYSDVANSLERAVEVAITAVHLHTRTVLYLDQTWRSLFTATGPLEKRKDLRMCGEHPLVSGRWRSDLGFFIPHWFRRDS